MDAARTPPPIHARRRAPLRRHFSRRRRGRHAARDGCTHLLVLDLLQYRGRSIRRAPGRLRPGVRWRMLARQPQALRYLATLFVYQFGLNAIMPYLVLFVVDEIHQPEQVAFALSAGLLVVTAVAAVLFGRLADRLGPRPVLAIGWSLLAVSALGGVLVTTLPQTIVVVIVAGVGNGAATAVA